MLQVSDKERQLELDSLFNDVASVLSEKCINPDNNKPYTISMLERALKDVHFSVDLHRNAKQQALEASAWEGLCVWRGCQTAFADSATYLLCTNQYSVLAILHTYIRAVVCCLGKTVICFRLVGFTGAASQVCH